MLSSAVFAPGWVFENQSKDNFFHNQDRLSYFVLWSINHNNCYNVYRFWSLLSQFRNSSKICGLPLVSSFGRGFGDKLAVDGKVQNLHCVVA